MRRLAILLLVSTLAACGGSGNPLNTATGGGGECSNDNQKQIVLDNLYAWYLWNDMLPAGIDIADYATPEELVTRVTLDFGPQDANGDPIDLFSSLGSAQADTQFFDEGEYEGFGFRWHLEAADEPRLSLVYLDSPANLGGLERGQRIVSLDGRSIAEIQANEGIDAVFQNDTVQFEMEEVGGNVFSVSITKATVTIDPVPRWRLIDMGVGGPPVGYMALSTFISTAEPVMNTVFAEFRNAGVTDVILDLRYNGGGLVSTAERLGDLLGGDVAENLVFSRTEFNADRAAANNSAAFFGRLANSISLSRLVVVASRGTASASELVTNGMIPHVDVRIVGDNTFGKPVGQIGLDFCEKRLRPTAFRLANADGDGDYFDGLPVDCPAVDDLSIPVGDDTDPNIAAAMSLFNTGGCPVVAAPGGQFKPKPPTERPEIDFGGRPEREFAGAY